MLQIEAIEFLHLSVQAQITTLIHETTNEDLKKDFVRKLPYIKDKLQEKIT